jgi:signal transduction histidine kinase
LAAIELAGEAMFVLDPAGGAFLGVNASACAILGRTREQVLETGPAQFSGWQAACPEIYRSAQAASESENVPVVSVTEPDGAKRCLRVRRIAPIAQVGWIVAAVDAGNLSPDSGSKAARSDPAEFSRLVAELLLAHDDERHRLGHALHGDVGQLLAASRIHLDLIRQQFGDGREWSMGWERLDNLLVSAIASVRRISSELHPRGLKEADLHAAFKALAEEVEARHGFSCEIDAAGAVDPTACEKRNRLVYRAVEDALTNVLPILRPMSAIVRLVPAPEILAIEICATGCRERAGLPEHRLLGLRERVRLLAGSLHMQCGSPDRAELTLQLPMHDAQPR